MSNEEIGDTLVSSIMSSDGKEEASSQLSEVQAVGGETRSSWPHPVEHHQNHASGQDDGNDKMTKDDGAANHMESPVVSASKIDMERGNAVGTTTGEYEVSNSTTSAVSTNAVTKPHHQQHQPSEIFVDHFTLPASSSDVRFRATNKKARIYTNNHSQFVLEEVTQSANSDRPNDGQQQQRRTMLAKRVSDATVGLRLLRAAYTLVCVFFSGFLFVFCIELLLFLVLDVAVEFGVTDIQERRSAIAASTILAIPTYVWGLASALVIAGQHAHDTWQGHSLVKRFLIGRFVGSVHIEWVSFFAFVGVPIMVAFITLLLGLDNWWEVTSMVWFACIFVFYIIFVLMIMYHEIKACLEVMKNRYGQDEVDTWGKLLRKAILLRQRRFFSGRRHVRYLTRGYMEGDEDCSNNNSRSSRSENYPRNGDRGLVSSGRSESVSLCSRLTQWSLYTRCGWYEQLEPPLGRRTYTIHDTKEVRPYITAKTWSLEKIYCRKRNSRYVAIVKGPGALSRAQLRSSFLCILVGNIFGLLLLLSLLLWLKTSATIVVLLVALVMICCLIPSMRDAHRVYNVISDLVREIDHHNSSRNAGTTVQIATLENHKVSSNRGTAFNKNDHDEMETQSSQGATLSSSSEEDICEGVYQVCEKYRISQPSDAFCWVMLGIETVALFLYPGICLFIVDNTVIGILFVVIGTCSWLRDHLNAAVVLEDAGSMDFMKGSTPTEEWQKRSRLNTIVNEITLNRAHYTYGIVLCLVVVLLLALFGFAIGDTNGTVGSNEKVVTPISGFMYEPQDNLEYPTCTLGKGFSVGGSPTTDMIDYVFLAKLAYQDPSLTQTLLDEWFGAGVATDMKDLVEEYRDEFDVSSVVSFKLIYFNQPKLGLVTIRGTVNAWDALTDVELWSAAAVFQGLRFLLPFGEVWNPILDNMVTLVSWLQSTSISKVSFYRDTTKFVEYLKSNQSPLAGELDTVQLTGHSLGGGLAIITGSQTDTPAVAVSGPNAMLSRHTFEPPLTVDALDTRTFNIIPDRDLVPRLDDRARLFQQIRCTAPVNELSSCHDSTRSLCEVIYACGTKNRPVICECALLFGYDAPIPVNSTAAGVVRSTFEEECKKLME